MAVGVGSQWLFNFVFSIATPYMITNMGSMCHTPSISTSAAPLLNAN